MTCGVAVGVSICWQGCSAPTDRCSQTSPWAGCLACQPGCLAGWLAGGLISQQPSSAYLLSSTSSLTLVFFILELHTAFLSNQLFHFLTTLCLSSGYYIRTLLGRTRKSSLSSLQYCYYVEDGNLHVAK
jgi:hypothetical protein